MSEQPEDKDSKPKLNLVISHNGTRTSYPVRYRRRREPVLRCTTARPCVVPV